MLKWVGVHGIAVLRPVLSAIWRSKSAFSVGTHVLSLETVLSMGTPKVPFNRDVFLGRLGRSGSEITLQFVIIIVPESQRTVLQIL